MSPSTSLRRSARARRSQSASARSFILRCSSECMPLGDLSGPLIMRRCFYIVHRIILVASPVCPQAVAVYPLRGASMMSSSRLMTLTWCAPSEVSMSPSAASCERFQPLGSAALADADDVACFPTRSGERPSAALANGFRDLETKSGEDKTDSCRLSYCIEGGDDACTCWTRLHAHGVRNAGAARQRRGRPQRRAIHRRGQHGRRIARPRRPRGGVTSNSRAFRLIAHQPHHHLPQRPLRRPHRRVEPR
ncbi:hypothetical protein B0H12DRAFT_388792 [Mycena haematopus]|nr:hypothetical protein B0H12DRAFT_388792 [Mycena haematopus]